MQWNTWDIRGLLLKILVEIHIIWIVLDEIDMMLLKFKQCSSWQRKLLKLQIVDLKWSSGTYRMFCCTSIHGNNVAFDVGIWQADG